MSSWRPNSCASLPDCVCRSQPAQAVAAVSAGTSLDKQHKHWPYTASCSSCKKAVVVHPLRLAQHCRHAGAQAQACHTNDRPDSFVEAHARTQQTTATCEVEQHSRGS